MAEGPRWDREEAQEQVLRRRAAAQSCRELPGWRAGIGVLVPVALRLLQTSAASLGARAILPMVPVVRWRQTIGENGAKADATGSWARPWPNVFAGSPSLPA